MTNVSKYPEATPDNVWAAIWETNKQLKEIGADFDRRLKESSADFDRRLKESNADFERQREKSSVDFERQREKSNADYERQRADYERQREKSNADYERQRADYERQREKSNADYERQRADYDKRMKKIEESFGAWGNNFGSFAEEYFFTSFENGKQNFFGEQFDEILKSVKGFEKGFQDEYDILLVNGKSIGIVEVKYKAHKNDVPKVLRKAKTFRVNFPNFAKHQIYLGLATLAFYPELEQECISEGIAVVKQLGDTVIINDAHLKVF